MTEFYFMNGEYVDASKAMIPVRTHAFLYGTAVFEGIRAYWNEDEKQLYAFRVPEHYVYGKSLYNRRILRNY